MAKIEKSKEFLSKFPKRDISYNPDVDVCAVVATDIIDIKDAFVNGLIPENVVATDADYDNNDDPKTIIGRPANEFEAIHLAATLKHVSGESKSEE